MRARTIAFALVAAKMARRASDIARAVNTLLDFSGDNQTALVEVIQDYFCEPDSEIEDDQET